MRPVYYLLFSSSVLVSCVSTGKYKAMQQEAQKFDTLYTWSMRTLKTCQDANNDLSRQKTDLQNKTNDLDLQLKVTQDNNSQLKKQLQSLSAISSAQAESIKKSLDNIGAKDQYIQDLRSAIAHRDSANLAVLMELKAALGGVGDEDLAIKVDKGTVYVDLSDKLLFDNDSNSYTITPRARTVLSRLARVLNDQPGVQFTVEGHTDSIAYPQDVLQDNWDRSVKRATAVVRILQNDYNVSPSRMTAAGKGEFATIAPNDTPEGRAANRRTRIILLPQLDQLLRLLEHGGQGQIAAPPAPVPATAPAPTTAAAPTTAPAQ